MKVPVQVDFLEDLSPEQPDAASDVRNDVSRHEMDDTMKQVRLDLVQPRIAPWPPLIDD